MTTTETHQEVDVRQREQPTHVAEGVWGGDSDVLYAQHRYHSAVVGCVVPGCPFCSSGAGGRLSPLTLRAIQAAAYANKVRQGFNLHDIPLEICLLHGEVAEFVDAWRRGHSDRMADELADVAIFVAGLAALVDVDLQAAVAAKLRTNAARRYALVDGVPTKQATGAADAPTPAGAR